MNEVINLSLDLRLLYPIEVGQPHQNTSAVFVSMEYFETIPDPRVLGRCKYRLCDILFIALATYVCGGEDYTDMHEFAIERAESLKDFVQFGDGVPSVDTFERLLGLIEPNSLNACLIRASSMKYAHTYLCATI